MARPKPPDLSHLARPGDIAVRVTPGAAANTVAEAGETLRVSVTAPPERGAANAAARALLAAALGVAKSRLRLVRGETSRDKLFRLEPR